MFARVASFEGGDTKRLQELNDERMASGSMDLPEGMRRALLLSDESGRRRMFVTFFESREAIASAWRELPNREQRVLALRFTDQLTQSEIGERIGISQMHVSRLLRRALARLQQAA